MKKSIRSFFELMLSGMAGKVLDMFSTFLCFLSFSMFILYTYDISMNIYFDYLDWVVIFYFLIEYFLRYL